MGQKRFILSISIILLFSLLILVPLTSANIFDWITGKLSERSTNLSIVVASITVDWVSSIAAQNVTENGITSVIFNFSASIPGGAVGDINDSSARANFTLGGEDTRENLSCAWTGDFDSDTANYTCNISLWYWDGTGSWTVSASVKDNSGNWATNSSTSFTLNEWTCFAVSPNALTWSGTTPGATNKTSNNDPSLLNNTCNDDTIVQVKAIDLQGESVQTAYIWSQNFTVDIDTGDSCSGAACIECDGTALQNNTFKNITSSTLPAGNNSKNFGNETSGQEKIYYCLLTVNASLPAQTYSTSGLGSWTIKII